MQVKFPFTVQSTQYIMCEEDQKKRKQRGRERGYDLSGKTEMRKAELLAVCEARSLAQFKDTRKKLSWH